MTDVPPPPSSLPPPPPTGAPGATAGNALAAWLGAFVVVQVATMVVLVATGYVDAVGSVPMSVNALLVSVMWAVQIVAVAWWASRSMHTTLSVATGLGAVPRDAWWIFVGLASQFLLVPAVNWPLSRVFPDSFSPEKVARRAEELLDSAPGAWFAVLALVVVVGAPVVEEIVYRGMVQKGFVSSWGPVAGVIVTAALFAAIHMSWAETPALFVFALVLGLITLRAGRLGPAIVTHMAFNLAGLVAVATT